VFRTPIYINSRDKCSSLDAGWFITQLQIHKLYCLKHMSAQKEQITVKIVGQKGVGREWVQKIGALVGCDRRMYVALTQADSPWWTHEWLLWLHFSVEYQLWYGKNIYTAAWTYLAKKFEAVQATQYNFCVSVSQRKVIEDWPFAGSLHRSECAIPWPQFLKFGISVFCWRNFSTH